MLPLATDQETTLSVEALRDVDRVTSKKLQGLKKKNDVVTFLLGSKNMLKIKCTGLFCNAYLVDRTQQHKVRRLYTSHYSSHAVLNVY